MASEKVRIHFEGKTLECRPDTTVAVALWENGIRHLSHSPKYGHPRGVTCARGHCTACLMRVDHVPNVRTCELPVREGMEVSRQDAGAFYAGPMQKILSVGHALFPVGFYYKWFTRPPFISHTFLKSIRPLTGIGRLPGFRTEALRLRPGPTEQVQLVFGRNDPAANLNPGPGEDLGAFDTVIVGAGPAGLAAAVRGSGSVLLVDDHATVGGQRFDALSFLANGPGDSLEQFPALGTLFAEIKERTDLLDSRPNLKFLGRTRAIAGYHPDSLLLRHEARLQTVKFANLVWAAGALDTLGLFPGNDTPGLFGPRALYRLVVRDGLNVTGLHALVVGDGLDFWLAAALLDSCGARLSLVVTGGGSAEIPAAVRRKWQLNTGLEMERITGKGDGGLRAEFTPGGMHTGPRLVTDADLAVVCNRGKPAYDIPYQLGADLSLVPEMGGFLVNPDTGTESGLRISSLPAGARLVTAGEAAGLLPGAATAGEVESR